MSWRVCFRGVCATFLFPAVLGLVGSPGHGQSLSRRPNVFPDSTVRPTEKSRLDSLFFRDIVLLGPRDLGEVARWLPGCTLLRYGGFGQPSLLMYEGVVNATLVSPSFVDPSVWIFEPSWSTWPVGLHRFVTCGRRAGGLFGNPVQVVADFPWHPSDRPYTRVGYTTGAYGLSQVAVRFTQRVAAGVQLWLEGSHDLYDGYELFSGFRNQLYVWRGAWDLQPHWRLRYSGRRFARDVDLSGSTRIWPDAVSPEAGQPGAVLHRKTAWTGHELELGWKPDSLRGDVLTLAVGYGNGQVEWRNCDPARLALLNSVRQGQMYVAYRGNRWGATASLGYFRVHASPGHWGHLDWRVRTTRRFLSGPGRIFNLVAGVAGGSSGGVQRLAPEAVLAFRGQMAGFQAGLELFQEAWFPRPRLWPCPDTVFSAKKLAQQTGIRVRLEGTLRGWLWLGQMGAVHMIRLPSVIVDPGGHLIVAVSQRKSATFTVGVVGPRDGFFFGRAKLDFYSNPIPGSPRIYGLVALGVRRRFFQGDLNVRALALGEFISGRTEEAALGYVRYLGSHRWVATPARLSPSLRVVAQFKDANLFFEVSHFWGEPLEYAPGFPDDPVAYRWGVWWELWD